MAGSYRFRAYAGIVVALCGGCFGDPDPANSGSAGDGATDAASTGTSAPPMTGADVDDTTGAAATGTAGATTAVADTGSPTSGATGTASGDTSGATGDSTGGPTGDTCPDVGIVLDPRAPVDGDPWTVTFSHPDPLTNITLTVTQERVPTFYGATGAPPCAMPPYCWEFAPWAAPVIPGKVNLDISADGIEPISCAFELQ